MLTLFRSGHLVMIKGGNMARIGVIRPKVTNFQDWKGKFDKG